MKEVKNLIEKGIAFVPFSQIDEFVIACMDAGVVPCGGAFSNDMYGQYFYI